MILTVPEKVFSYNEVKADHLGSPNPLPLVTVPEAVLSLKKAWSLTSCGVSSHREDYAFGMNLTKVSSPFRSHAFVMFLESLILTNHKLNQSGQKSTFISYCGIIRPAYTRFILRKCFFCCISQIWILDC